MKRREISRTGIGRGVRGIMVGTVAVGLALGTAGAGVQADAVSINASRHNPQWLVQILFDKGTESQVVAGTAQPWTLSTFQKFASEGITGVEINMDWAAVESSPGQFNWTTLQTYLQYCHETHLKLIPIFWEFGAPGNPPSWLPGGSEITSTGASAAEPAFWSQRAFNAYSTYVTQALTTMGKSSAFGGAYIAYGWLDAGYGPTSSGLAGYAPQDIAMFRQWLAQRYGSITAFNQAVGTDYASFATVPAFVPGQSHFSIYQQFRTWSYKTLLGRVLSLARKATPAPLYIYYGGGMNSVGQLGNLPNNVFELAQKYHAVVTMDTAIHTAFDALFGFLSQSYKVPVLNEWTPVPGSPGQLAQWLGQYPLEGSYAVGEDYYKYQGTGYQQSYFANTYPNYLAWHPVLDQIQGSLPSYKVGIMLGYDQVLHNALGSGITGGVTTLSNYLRAVRPAANVFSDLSVLDGTVSLSQFHTIIDWNSDLQAPNLNPRLLADLKAFQTNGGIIIPGPAVANANAFAPLNLPDGQFTVQTVLGQQTVVSQLGVSGASPYVQYLYFKVPPNLVPSTQPNVQIQVTYANNQANGFYLQYDSSNASAPVNGAYTTGFPAGTNAPVAVTNTGQYKTATFDLTNAAFTGAENGGADFRVAIENPGLAVSSVTITAGGQSASFTPGELSNPQAPPALVVTPNSSQFETFLSAGQGKVWLVAANTGTTAFSGTVTIPSSVLNPLLSNHGDGPIRTQSLMGSWQPAGTNSWKITLAGGNLAVLAIQPG